jgi:hypothetical protein
VETSDLTFNKHLADKMAKNYPDQQFKVVRGMRDDFMVCSIGTKTACETVYTTEVPA